MRSPWVLAAALFLGCGGATDTGPARDTITAEALRSDVEVLASDAFLGRGTGERGAELAANHVAEALAEIGLRPLPGRSELQIPYTLYRQGWSQSSTVHLTLGETELDPAAGVGFRPFRFSDEGEIDGQLVFAGYGITAPELEWDDYAGLDVRGKVVVLLRHDPGEGTDDARWKDHGGHALFTSKARNAAEHGAVGMILVTDPLNHGPDTPDHADDLRLEGRMQLSPPEDRPRSRREDVGDTPFLAVHASRAVGDALVAPMGRDLAALQRALNAGEAPNCAIEGGRARLALQRQAEPEAIEATNVVGFLPGSDPALADEWVVIGAHYDHLGAFQGEGDTVYNGADDNASGTAGLLALARAFAALPAGGQPKRSVVFAAFSGEEHGLLGSEALLRDGVLPARQLAFMLNLDMIGRGEGELEVTGDGYGTGLKAAVLAAANDPELPLDFAGTDYNGNSDHHSFKEQDVPFLFLSTGLHEDYHQLSDEVGAIDAERMRAVVQLAFGVANQVASGALTPRFVQHINWLGVQVELVDTGEGVRPQITAVEPDSRASRAGFAVGDRIHGFGDTPLEAARDVGPAYRAIEPGAKARIAVDRANSRMTFTVERARTGYLGVWPAELTDEFRARHGLSDDEGLLLRQVMEDTPAAAAGLRDGDALIALQGVRTSLGSLSRTLTRIGAGETVPITVIRDGERLDLTMTLGERPERP